ncbi:hypothetical protein A0128_18305 [Leptospira tipperaryensis]|uniref:Uncharacterized protein n=1 Tax=Leptospira tipperaryensis TaxID=2564040 RepID=A0A1D7V197_9LEPT|nr:hypothetical protein [Leptospira tipperaryensis]AOP35624.1 hypothetical protein A0128_18305 [Leptospira tipperaryensis]
MKIRWVNNVQYLPQTFPKWILFGCKYPITFLLLGLINGGIGYFLFYWYYYGIQYEWLPNKLNSGKSSLDYNNFLIFFLIFLIVSGVFFWLFWVLALSKPAGTITVEEAIEMSKKFDSKLQPTASSFSLKDFMKIRWINHEVQPLPGSPSWIVFVCKYPFLYLLPTLILFPYAYFWYRWILEWESGEKERLYFGKLSLLYDLFGKTGVIGFYLSIGGGFLWLFWYYAIRKPKN